jgi:GTP-binding protein Era
LVREKLFRHLDKEVPYRAATWTEEWTERPDGRIYMRVVIQTDKASHKGIIIGAGGKMLARIGAEARAEIEELCGAPVFLELWVRVRLKWRQDPRELARLELGAD